MADKVTPSRSNTADRDATVSTIADAADRAKKLLSYCARVDDEDTKAFASNQLGRFNVWASNIDVFAAPPASLDYRLRPVPTVAVAIRGNLEILCRRSLEVLKPGENTIDEDLRQLSGKPLEEVFDWLQTIIPEYLPGHIVSPTARDRIVSKARKKIVSTITTLHRLSLSIREASACGPLEQQFNHLGENTSDHSKSAEIDTQLVRDEENSSTNFNKFLEKPAPEIIQRRSSEKQNSEENFCVNQFTFSQASRKTEFTTVSASFAYIEPGTGQPSGHSNLDSRSRHDAGRQSLAWTSPQSVREFRSWTEQCAVEGLTSGGEAARYIPLFALSQYWSSGNIKEIFQSFESVLSTKDLSDYICIFSTLVYMEAKGVSALHYLDKMVHRGYDDASLPWTENTTQGHDIFESTDDLKRFIDTQWMFYPLPVAPFLTTLPTVHSRVSMHHGWAKPIHNRSIHVKQIFPIREILDRPTDISRAERRVNVSYMKVHSPSSTQQSPPVSDPNICDMTQARIVDTTKAHTNRKWGQNIVVFKTYPPGEEKTYMDESRGYTAMQDAKHRENILQCLGSFYYINERDEKFSTIMLEFSDSGTLMDLFSGNKVPYREEHVRSMWDSFLGALYGLATIHNRNSPGGYLCFHQDLKPSNFFLFGPEDDKGPFEYSIKIGDFGTSHSRYVDAAVHEETSPDKGATETYGPPETHVGNEIDLNVESSADMWAIGCIMIEMAVWITGGKLGLDEFRRYRMEEKEAPIQHKSLARNDCFHDGNDVLRCVKAVVQAITENGRKHDDITPHMVQLALEYVLIDKNERLHAHQLIPRIRRALKDRPVDKFSMNPNTPPFMHRLSNTISSPSHDKPVAALPHGHHSLGNQWSAQAETQALVPYASARTSAPLSSFLPSSPPESPESMRPSDSNLEAPPSIRLSTVAPLQVSEEVAGPATKTSFPFVSIVELQEWVNSIKTHTTTDLRGRNEAKLLLDGRDFIFLIDNSRHVRACREELKTCVTSLTYLLKTVDPDGIEVANTSAPQAGKKVKSKTDMSKFVDQTFAREIEGDCMIENALNFIFDPIKTRWSHRRSTSTIGRRNRLSIPGIGQRNQSSRGVTVLVFTNGVWDRSATGASGAEKPITSLMESMRKNDIPRTQVSIQFVRLGNEERGIRRLKILDDLFNEQYDIVDTKPITASIWDILIGSMQADNDDDILTSS